MYAFARLASTGAVGGTTYAVAGPSLLRELDAAVPGDLRHPAEQWSRHGDADPCPAVGRAALLPGFLFDHDSAPERVRQAYTEEDHQRLTTLKARYDPAQFFRVNHHIPPSPDVV